MIENRNEVRYTNSAFERLHSHGQLVAEIPHGSEAHTGYTHVLAQGSCCFHVVFVERDNAVDLLFSRNIADRVYDLRQRKVRRNVEDIVQTLARPSGFT